MPVYMIAAGSYAVKIGKADDVKFRLGQLQVGNHEELRILRIFEGGEAEEAQLHAKFCHLHRRGDWFSFSREMLGDVGLKEITQKKVDFDRLAGMALIRAKRSLSAKIAAGLGISTGAVAQWEQVPANRATEIEKITGIPRHQLRPDLWEPPVLMTDQQIPLSTEAQP